MLDFFYLFFHAFTSSLCSFSPLYPTTLLHTSPTHPLHLTVNQIPQQSTCWAHLREVHHNAQLPPTPPPHHTPSIPKYALPSVPITPPVEQPPRVLKGKVFPAVQGPTTFALQYTKQPRCKNFHFSPLSLSFFSLPSTSIPTYPTPYQRNIPHLHPHKLKPHLMLHLQQSTLNFAIFPISTISTLPHSTHLCSSISTPFPYPTPP